MPDNPGAQATFYEEPAWLAHLNPAQREAVTLPMDSHGAILAGAGTGKTRFCSGGIGKSGSKFKRSQVAETRRAKSGQSRRNTSGPAMYICFLFETLFGFF